MILLDNDLLIFLSDIELKQGNNDNGTGDEGGQNDHHDMCRELRQTSSLQQHWISWHRSLSSASLKDGLFAPKIVPLIESRLLITLSNDRFWAVHESQIHFVHGP